MVVVLGHRGGAEGIAFDQIGAGRQIFLVDSADDVRLGQRQQFVIAFDEQLAAGAGEVNETTVGAAAIIFFRQLILLDHGAHRAIQDQDALREQLAQAGFSGQGSGRSCGGKRH